MLKGHPYGGRRRKKNDEYYMENPHHLKLFVGLKLVKIVFEDEKTAPKDDKVGKKEYFAKKEQPKKVLTQKTVTTKKETPKKQTSPKKKEVYKKKTKGQQQNDMFRFSENKSE